MLLVVFGAGASYDSLLRLPPEPRSIDGRPPLADQLFAAHKSFLDLMNQFPDLNPIVGYLQSGKAVEQELQSLRKRAGPDSPIHRSLMAVRYYLQSLIASCELRWKAEYTRGHTNHETLLFEIEEWRRSLDERVLIVTFNYDRLIEDALSGRAGISIKETSPPLRSYIQEPSYKLFKLHGSVNWLRGVQRDWPQPLIGDLSQREAAQRHIEMASTIRLTDTYALNIGADGRIGHLGGNPFVPAIAIPVEQKDGFECPQEHVTVLRELLPKVTKLIVIGWRGAEADFVEMLRAGISSRRPPALIVCGTKEENAKTINNLAGVSADFHSFDDGGFSTLIREKAVELWLRKWI